MQVVSVAPSPRLAPFVERFHIVESADEATRVLLPQQGLALGVRYRGAGSLVDGERAIRLPSTTLTGLLGAARRMRTHAGGGIVVAQFRPAGAARFFSAPLHELFGATVPLDALVRRAEVERLSERVAAAADHAGRAAAIEEFLLARMSEPVDPLVEAAIASLRGSRGSIRIADLARGLAVGQDSLEKRFRRAVGGAPKQLASLIRVQHAIDLGRAGASWSRVAHEAGYFDQSHFNREFRAIIGQSPTRFFRAGDHC